MGTVRSMTTESIAGRVAVITGASSGIGEATARALAADGHRLALLARRADRIEALADELGDGAIAIEADVADRGALVAAARRVEDELGGADILVNNAGVMLLASVHLRSACREAPDGRGQPARRDDRDGGRPRPAPRRRGTTSWSSRRSSFGSPAIGNDCIRCDEVGPERLIGGAAPGAPARYARDRHRARRYGERASIDHITRRVQRGGARSTTLRLPHTDDRGGA